MKGYTDNILAQLAQLALSAVMYCISRLYFLYRSGTLLAQLALSKIVCATCAKFVPLKNKLKPLLIADCATNATNAMIFYSKIRIQCTSTH